jgi:hypothetical protein
MVKRMNKKVAYKYEKREYSQQTVPGMPIAVLWTQVMPLLDIIQTGVSPSGNIGSLRVIFCRIPKAEVYK